MPTIQFKGKNIIWNHHLSVPYHTLDEVEDLHYQPKKGNGNLTIEGDNLIALKALLPQYAGKVKCIYIDPPYNTGNEGWVYNDNINSPLIKEWLGKEIGSDDLTKHDKWLCMMTPRLKLLRDLLADDGVIFISVDDNEVSNLEIAVNEVFVDNVIGKFIWKKKQGGGNDSNLIVIEHEYVLVVAKDKNAISFYLDKNYELSDSLYPFKDNTGEYGLITLDKSSIRFSDSLVYEITDNDGNKYMPRVIKGKQSCWRWGKSKVENEFDKLVLKNGKIYTKYYRPEGVILRTLLTETYHGRTETGNDDIKSLFGNSKPFDYPKPVSLIKHLLSISTYENDIILDSFAGSGTTTHAVNELNKEDGGNRKCILVQMTEASPQEPKKNICKDITRERNKPAIEKYGYNTGFKYFRVGKAIDPDKMLDGELPTYEEFAKYVYYIGTGQHLVNTDKLDAKSHYVGTHGPKNFYLIYKQDFDKLTRMALTLSIAEKIIEHSKNKRIVVYAPACFLDNEYLEEKQIEFVSIPYNLFEKTVE